MDETELPVTPWHAVEGREAVGLLRTSLDAGLDSSESANRLRRHGPNTLETEARAPWPRVLVILAIVVLNGLLGFPQEWKTERALQALRRMLKPRCTVLRDQVD